MTTSEESTMEELQCPVCLEIPPKEINQCPDGHTVCARCYSNLTTCPQCRAPYRVAIRCRALEAQLDKMTFQCPNKGLGCTELLKRGGKENHVENECSFQEKSFGLCEYLGYRDCRYKTVKTKFHEAVAHFREKHQFRIATSNEATISHDWPNYVGKRPSFPLRWNPVVFMLNAKEPGGGNSALAIVSAGTVVTSLRGGGSTSSERSFEINVVVMPDKKVDEDYSVDVTFQVSGAGSRLPIMPDVKWKTGITVLARPQLHYTQPIFIMCLDSIKLHYMPEQQQQRQFPVKVSFQSPAGDCSGVENLSISSQEDTETVRVQPFPIGKILTSPATCGACHATSSMILILYKCLQCPNFDICMDCMESGEHSEHVFAILKNEEQKDHLRLSSVGNTRPIISGMTVGGTPYPEEEGPIFFSSAKCTGCLAWRLAGTRYTCLFCPEVDLCGSCFDAEIHGRHIFGVVKNRSQELLVDGIQAHRGAILRHPLMATEDED